MRTAETYNLAEALEDATQEQRNVYARLWGMTGETYADIDEFMQLALDSLDVPFCARFVWEYLSPDERQIFYHSMSYSAREGLRRDVLQVKSQLTPEKFEVAADSLLHSLLLYQRIEKMEAGKRGHHSSLSRDSYTSEGRVAKNVPVIYPFAEYLDTLYTIGREIFTPLGDRSPKLLVEILQTLDLDMLYEIYENYEVQWKTRGVSSDLITVIANTLTQLEEPLDFLPDLDMRAHHVYLWLRRQGGRATMQDVRSYSQLNDAELSEVLYALEASCLAFDTLTRQERVLFIPHDVFTQLKQLKSDVKEAVVVTEVLVVPEDYVPSSIRHSEPTLLYDMAFVVSAIQQQTIEPTQVGRVPKRIATKIRTQLRGFVRPDFQYEDNYLEMLLDIAKDNLLLQRSKSPLPDIKDRYDPGDRLEWWSHLDNHGQIAYMLSYWQKSGRWVDLEGKHFRAWDPYSWEPVRGRKVLLQHLMRCQPERWYTVAALLQEIWEKDAFAMHPPRPYGRKNDQRKSNEVREKWDKCDAETYIGMLSSTLYELGIVNLGYTDPHELETKVQHNPQSFMLTEMGVAILPQIGDNPSPAEESGQTLIVQPSFELLIMQPDMPTLYSLLPFTQLNQVGIVSRLQLNRNALLRGLEAGKTLETIIETLQKHSQKELPQNVLYSLNDWARLYKGVKLSQVLLFEVSSEAVANELTQTPKFQELGLRQLAPCIFAASNAIPLKQLKQALEKEGIAVQISGNIMPTSSQYETTYDRYR